MMDKYLNSNNIMSAGVGALIMGLVPNIGGAMIVVATAVALHKLYKKINGDD